MQHEPMRRPRAIRPPVSIHMMGNFYDPYAYSSSSAGSFAHPGPTTSSTRSLKRKRGDSTDPSDDDLAAPPPYRQSLSPTTPHGGSGEVSGADSDGPLAHAHVAKRARLADDFAGMKLRPASLSPKAGSFASAAQHHQTASVPPPTTLPTVEEPPEIEWDSAGSSFDPNGQEHYLHYPSGPNPRILRNPEVEELLSPAVRAEHATKDKSEGDVKMHGTSWYEPEKDRIVITDLENYSDDEIETQRNAADGEYHINPAYLAKFGRIPHPDQIPEADRQAVVAYCPLVQTINRIPAHLNRYLHGYIEEVEEPVDTSSSPSSSSEGSFKVEMFPDDAMDVDME